jgi:chaperonin GroES
MITPVGKKVLVKREEKKDRTESGLYLPETSKETSNKATVVAVGKMPKTENYEFPVAVGDEVLVSRYDGTEVVYDGEKYVLIGVDSILAVITK